MSFGTPQGVNLMLGWKRGNRFAQGLGAQLPIAYKKFWEEWKVQKPSPVHYVVANPDEKYKVDPKTGRVILNQTVSLPLKGVSEENKGLFTFHCTRNVSQIIILSNFIRILGW
jgi:large subunit ribosomal protein L28